MAHKKGVGSSKNGRESESKRLGIKLFGGERCKAGNIICRQRGTSHHPGENVGIGRDHTIYALIDGFVVFRRGKDDRSYISVKSLISPETQAVEPTKKVKAAKPVAEAVEAAVAVAEAVETIAEAAPVETEAAVAEVVAKPKKAAAPKTAKPKAEKAAEPAAEAAPAKKAAPKAAKAKKED